MPCELKCEVKNNNQTFNASSLFYGVSCPLPLAQLRRVAEHATICGSSVGPNEKTEHARFAAGAPAAASGAGRETPARRAASTACAYRRTASSCTTSRWPRPRPRPERTRPGIEPGAKRTTARAGSTILVAGEGC